MDTDLYLTIGLILLVFSVPAVVSALTDRRPPRLAAIVLMIGGVLTAVALARKPGGYMLSDIPEVIVRVVARFVG